MQEFNDAYAMESHMLLNNDTMGYDEWHLLSHDVYFRVLMHCY